MHCSRRRQYAMTSSGFGSEPCFKVSWVLRPIGSSEDLRDDSTEILFQIKIKLLEILQTNRYSCYCYRKLLRGLSLLWLYMYLLIHLDLLDSMGVLCDYRAHRICYPCEQSNCFYWQNFKTYVKSLRGWKRKGGLLWFFVKLTSMLGWTWRIKR